MGNFSVAFFIVLEVCKNRKRNQIYSIFKVLYIPIQNLKFKIIYLFSLTSFLFFLQTFIQNLKFII